MVHQFETRIGYDFNAAGMYEHKDYLYTEETMVAWMHAHVGIAFREGREIIITDTGDTTVFHIKDGKVLHARGYDVDAFTVLLRLRYTMAG